MNSKPTSCASPTLAGSRRPRPTPGGPTARRRWLMHAVHGNEISSSDAAMPRPTTCCRPGRSAVDAILANAIVLIDPLQNPDGGTLHLPDPARSAAVPDPEPAAASTTSPGWRPVESLPVRHNRDWFAQSQPRPWGARVLPRWFPHVVVDLHEMGGDSTYYFAPPADPLNPFISQPQLGWFQTFGVRMLGGSTSAGSRTSVASVRLVLPGIRESWPIFQGAIGMTYEQASTRGLVWRRDDETVLTYRDAVVHHSRRDHNGAHRAMNRERLLRDFLEYRAAPWPKVSEGRPRVPAATRTRSVPSARLRASSWRRASRSGALESQ